MGWRLGFSALLCVCPAITWYLLLLPLQHCLQDHTVHCTVYSMAAIQTLHTGRAPLHVPFSSIKYISIKNKETLQNTFTGSFTIIIIMRSHHHSKYSCKWQDGGEGLRVRHLRDGQTNHSHHRHIHHLHLHQHLYLHIHPHHHLHLHQHLLISINIKVWYLKKSVSQGP